MGFEHEIPEPQSGASNHSASLWVGCCDCVPLDSYDSLCESRGSDCEATPSPCLRRLVEQKDHHLQGVRIERTHLSTVDVETTAQPCILVGIGKLSLYMTHSNMEGYTLTT